MGYWQNRAGQRVSLPTQPLPKNHLYEIASEVRNQLVETISTGARHGRTYKRGEKLHTASAPGEPPVTDSGQLVNSISQPLKTSENEYKITIANEYALYLEVGSINIRPRPFVDRSIKKAIEELKDRGVL